MSPTVLATVSQIACLWINSPPNTIDIGLINVVSRRQSTVCNARSARCLPSSCFMQLLPPTPMTAHLLNWESTIRIYCLVMDWWFAYQAFADAAL